jgi:hypothetical protein
MIASITAIIRFHHNLGFWRVQRFDGEVAND